jgi:predicted NAD/FAD-binding protein
MAEEIAVIGAGIAGLGCAYFLAPHHRVTVFEMESRLGGHAHTVEVDEDARQIPVDTGFMVYNEVTYPMLTRLFRELGVPTKPTSMSFSVRDDRSGLEYCGSSLNHLFAQRRNLLRPAFWRFLLSIDRFNRDAVEALEDPGTRELTLEQYVRSRGYGSAFMEYFLVPMSGAVWSAPPAEMLRFPAATLLRFFHNHGFLGLHTQHPWRTVCGGSRSYVSRLTGAIDGNFQSGSAVVAVSRRPDGVDLTLSDGTRRRFDRVVLACHADQALGMLANPTAREGSLLGAFRYQCNPVTLHTDETVMPRTRRAWASWNYCTSRDRNGCSTHYWMNSLQGVSDRRNYFVSLNAEDSIAPGAVLRRLRANHPLFDLRAVRAQAELPSLLRAGDRTLFCGSYFRYGFHEDALASAHQAASVILQRDAWMRYEKARDPEPLVAAGVAA